MKRFALINVITVFANMLLSTYVFAGSPYDDYFNDNSINPALWQKFAEAGGDIAEVNQRLEYTSSSTADSQGFLSSNWFIDLTEPFQAKLDFDSSGAPDASDVSSDVWLILLNPYNIGDSLGELWMANGVYDNYYMDGRAWWACSMETEDSADKELFTSTDVTSGTFYMWSNTPNTILVGYQDFDNYYMSFDISGWGTNVGYFDIGGWSDGTSISSGMYLDNFELVQGTVVPEPSSLLLSGLGLLSAGLFKKVYEKSVFVR